MCQDIEVVKAGSGDDELSAHQGTVRLEGGAGADEFFERGAGAPVSDGGAGSDAFYGGTIDYSGRTNAITVLMDGLANDGEPGEGDFVSHGKVVGGSGNDTFVASDIAGGAFVGGPGSDDFFGPPGAGDFSRGTVEYSDRADAVNVTFDGVANDGRVGEADNVRADIRAVIGGSGNDRLVGSGAANDLYGGPGDDRLDGGLGGDVLDGGPGFDIVDYSARTGPLSVTLNQFGPPDDGEVGEGDRVLPTSNMILGGSGHDFVCTCGSNLENERYGAAGGEGNDNLGGGFRDDTFRGGPGDDTLYGSNGHDILDGGAGNDSLRGLEGDLLDGGTGADVIASAFIGGFADYSARVAPVTVTLDDIANDGESG